MVPQVKSAWRRWFGVGLLWLTGWRFTGNFPDLRKFVLIVAPHTSNWDFFYGACAYFALQIETTWLVKQSAVRGLTGALARHFGAAGIDRAQAEDIVQAYVDEFQRRDAMVLTITPEGTRKKVPDWKSGFYRVAVAAQIPIVPVALDFSQRRIIVHPAFYPSGDFAADLPKIKAFYRAEMARHPANF